MAEYSTIEAEAYRLMEICSKVEDELGSPYKRYNESSEDCKKRARHFLEVLVSRVQETTDLNNFDRHVWDILEDENFHTLCTAIDIALGGRTIEIVLDQYLF